MQIMLKQLFLSWQQTHFNRKTFDLHLQYRQYTYGSACCCFTLITIPVASVEVHHTKCKCCSRAGNINVYRVTFSDLVAWGLVLLLLGSYHMDKYTQITKMQCLITISSVLICGVQEHLTLWQD